MALRPRLSAGLPLSGAARTTVIAVLRRELERKLRFRDRRSARTRQEGRRPASLLPTGGKPGYLMSLMMLNIGMYSDTTMAPTAPPSTQISSGSSSDVSDSTVASTSRS